MSFLIMDPQHHLLVGGGILKVKITTFSTITHLYKFMLNYMSKQRCLVLVTGIHFIFNTLSITNYLTFFEIFAFGSLGMWTVEALPLEE